MALRAGALRFNTDSSQMEIYDGNQWTGILATSPELQTGGARGLFFFAFDNTGSEPKMVDYITIPTTGNAIDFGDMSGNTTFYGGVMGASRTRAIYAGGYKTASPYYTNEIQYVEIATTGNSQDFGDLTAAITYNPSGVSNNTRGIRCGGAVTPTTSVNILDFVQIATTGNAQDFGDMVRERRFSTSSNTPVRGFVTGGSDGGTKFSDTELINIASTGNSSNFGDLGDSQQDGNNGVICSSTRAIMGGGSTPSVKKIIRSFEMSSLGDHQEFGDLSAIRANLGGCSSPVRGVFGGGFSSPAYLNIIEFVNISTGGDAVDFGDRTESGSYLSGASNAHGGL